MSGMKGSEVDSGAEFGRLGLWVFMLERKGQGREREIWIEWKGGGEEGEKEGKSENEDEDEGLVDYCVRREDEDEDEYGPEEGGKKEKRTAVAYSVLFVRRSSPWISNCTDDPSPSTASSPTTTPPHLI
jgi:hypothetical protein